MATDEPEVITLEQRIDRLEHELAAVKSQYETVLTGWPTVPTQAQGFLGHRWQRRDGDGYAEPIEKIPEAPSDSNYYGRHDFGWSPVVPLAGNVTMTGPLIVDQGTTVTSVGLGVGDTGSGLLRVGGALVIANGGQMVMQFLSDRTAMMVTPLSMAAQRISNLADPTAAVDALNLRTADARYPTLASGGIIAGPLQVLTAPFVPNDAANKLYVDQRRAPTVVYDLPANVTVPGDSQWHEIASVPVSIPRGGPSMIMVSVSCNVSDLANLGLIGVRLLSGTPERRVFTYGGGPPDNIVSGFFASFTTNIVGDALSVPVEVNSLSFGGTPPAFTIVGGGPLVAARSQIVIVDLGPVATVEEVDAEETEPSGAGRRERRAARPHYRRPA